MGYQVNTPRGKMSEIRKRNSAAVQPIRFVDDVSDDEREKRKPRQQTLLKAIKQLIPPEHRINVALGALLFVLLLINYSPSISKVFTNIKKGNLRFTAEPLPTVDTVKRILSTWEDNATKIDTLLQPLRGPIPNHLFIVPCDRNYAIEDGKCQPNIDNTIAHYAQVLNNFSQPVTYLTPETCLPLIQNVEPKLADAYEYETFDVNKSYICRIAALYLYGGYFFDSDVEVRVPYVPHPQATFSTAIEASGSGFFQAFLAATPHHPVMQVTLENMVAYYDKALIRPDPLESKAEKDKIFGDDEFKAGLGQEGGGDDEAKQHLDSSYIPDDVQDWNSGPYIDFDYVSKLKEEDPGWNMGTRTLKNAYSSLPSKSRGETAFVQEIHLSEDHAKWYPDITRRESDKCCCNFVVHDPGSNVVHFWSRIVGSAFC